MAALVVSLFMIAVQKVMYDEVGREIRTGLENAGEIVFVNLGLVMNAVFSLLAIGLAVLAFRRPQSDTALEKGAPIFTLAQYMGIVSGLLGLLLTLALTSRQIPVGARFWVFGPLLPAVPGALRAILSSGRAVVVHRLAVMSNDGDWILRETEDAPARVLGVRERHGAPLDVRWMRGGWRAGFEFRQGAIRVRADDATRAPAL